MDTAREYSATPINARAARKYVAGHFTSHPAADTAEHLASELIQNAIRHGDGTVFTVEVDNTADRITVYVTNTGDGGRVPERRGDSFTDLDSENGRGIDLVAHLADTYGYAMDNARVIAWFAFNQPSMAVAA